MKHLSRWIFIWILIITFWVQPATAFGQSQIYGNKLGTVEFSASCNQDVAQEMQRGLALLHHMTYSGAEDIFRSVIKANPNCAMGYWGLAMTFIHPLWPDPPDELQMKDQLELLNKAKTLARGNQKSLLYIDAVEAYYKDGWMRSENERLASFDEGWRKVYQHFPDDPEAASFYSLAHMSYEYSKMAAAPSSNKNYEGLEQAAAIAEKVVAKIPEHPGANHYIIHAYDMEGLADRGLAAARNYGKIAPDVPHALHMPSHIFTRLGLWEESIPYNIRSAAAGLKHPHHGAISHHYFHDIDYLMYAYLQSGEDKKAKEILSELNKLEGPFHISPATAYTLAAVPGRYPLERRQWADAASLELMRPPNFPWEIFPQYEALLHYARAIGAARSGDESTAKEAIEKLALLQDKIKDKDIYWTNQIEIQRTTADAWLQLLKGEPEQASKTMQRAAEMEASTYKHPITPGEILPARELFADLLMQIEKPDQALNEYELSLQRTPNRFNSLFGAGKAAEALADEEKAKFYYGKLLEICSNQDSERPALMHAKAFVSKFEQ